MKASWTHGLRGLLLSGCVAGSACLVAAAAEGPFGPGPIRVFHLAGQSNMQGQGAVSHLRHLAEDAATAEAWGHLVDDSGEWVVRRDVFVTCIGRDAEGGLTVGFGRDADKIGPELGFGWVVGEALDDPVVVIKTCWGGRNLKEDYLPPGAGGPGPAYEAFVEGVHERLDSLGRRFPELEGRKWKVSGFVWFQGWNDMVDGAQREGGYTDYTDRLAQLVRDLRREFDEPRLPVVIGELGVGGPERRGAFQKAQAAAASLEEWQGRVRFVPTADVYDMEIHRLYEADVWKGPDKDVFYRVGNDRPYHYLGSGKIYYRMGEGFGRGILEILGVGGGDCD